jgi:pimeloyl-ACP methyl ester carboxylesterase
MTETPSAKAKYSDVAPDAGVDGFEPTFVDVDGIRTRYYHVGGADDGTMMPEKDAMVLLHGGSWEGSMSANTWTPVLDGLAERFEVFALDRLGNGLTDHPDSTDDFTHDAEFEHLLGFLDEHEIESAHMVGQSRGGGLGGRLAVERPDRVRTLTVVNSGTLAPNWGDYPYRRNRLHRDDPDDPDSPTYYQDKIRHFEEMIGYTTDHVTDEYVRAAAFMRENEKGLETARLMREGARERWHQSVGEAMDETQRRIKAGDLTAPTLLYWGRNDPTSVLEQGRALYELISQTNPNVRQYIVDKAGHHVYREYPAEFVAMVTAFVEQFRDPARNHSPGAFSPDGVPEWYDSKDR